MDREPDVLQSMGLKRVGHDWVTELNSTELNKSISNRLLCSSAGKESPCNAGDPGLIPRLGKSAGEEIGYPLQYSWFLWWLTWLRILLKCERTGFHPWVGKIPWRRERLPTLVFWPGEFQGLYSLWGRNKLDMTEQLSLSHFMHNYYFKYLHYLKKIFFSHESSSSQ